MNIEPGKLSKNVETARQGVLEASGNGAELVLLPELWSTGYDLPNAAQLAQKNTELETDTAAWSALHRIWLGGSVLKNGPSGIQNTFQLHDPSGKIVSQYPKIHLFGLMNEDRYLIAGDKPVAARTPWGKTGLSICYDLRFPELFRTYAVAGCALILLSAEWPLKRIFHWETLLKARAIENQVFIAATNCVGRGGDEVFGGSSAIISPWGEVLAVGSKDQEEILTAEIDMDEVQRTKKTIPILTDRRPDAYFSIPDGENPAY